MIQQRVTMLQKRYRDTYGEELTNDEVARYVNGLLIDAQRNELRVFDNLSPAELVATINYLGKSSEEAPHQGEPVAPPPPFTVKKPRGRPVGWRKVKA